MPVEISRKLDAIGLFCPEPVFRTRRQQCYGLRLVYDSITKGIPHEN